MVTTLTHNGCVGYLRYAQAPHAKDHYLSLCAQKRKARAGDSRPVGLPARLAVRPAVRLLVTLVDRLVVELLATLVDRLLVTLTGNRRRAPGRAAVAC